MIVPPHTVAQYAQPIVQDPAQTSAPIYISLSLLGLYYFTSVLPVRSGHCTNYINNFNWLIAWLIGWLKYSPLNSRHGLNSKHGITVISKLRRLDHRWSVCLRRTDNGRTAVLALSRKSASGLAMNLTCDLEHLFSNSHWNDEYLCQVSFYKIPPLNT